MNAILAIVLAVLSLASITVHAADPPPKDVSQLLGPIIQKRNVPGMAAAVVRNGETVAVGVAGVRTRGKDDEVAVADRFHIGSDTKAMTAFLCGILVDEGKLKWGQTLGETFPEHKRSMHPQYHAVTLEQLLTHRGGAAGVRGGLSWGRTDELGYTIVEHPVHVHDLNATVLHLLGLDHTKLTFKYQGRQYRLTDVHGSVVRDVLA